jgi:hypothetical protein
MEMAYRYKYRIFWFDGRMEESEETFETRDQATREAEWRLANVPVDYRIIEVHTMNGGGEVPEA